MAGTEKGIYKDKKCTGKVHPPFTPVEHQKYATKYFLQSPNKGLLLYHKLGSGKTCTSIMIGDAMLKAKKVKIVYVLSPGALRKNWLDEYCKTCGSDRSFLEKYFVFITSNYNVEPHLHKLNFQDSLVIIDEVQNLINGEKNKSLNADALYNKILSSNCRVLALSGTPILNKPEKEWYILGNLLKPGTFTPAKVYTKEQLSGIVSYFPGDPALYPDTLYHDPIKCEMPESQYNLYNIAYKSDMSWRNRPPEEKLRRTDPSKYWFQHAMYIKARKWFATRAASNFSYPLLIEKGISTLPFIPEQWDAVKDMPVVKDNNMTWFDVLNTKETPDELMKNGGWVSSKTLADNAIRDIYSSKFYHIIDTVLKHFNTKHAIYTIYKEKSGVNLLATFFRKCGVPVGVYSGDLDDKGRSKLLDTFNSVENRNGDIIKILFITEAGTAGITLLEVNNMHIVESSPTESNTRQAIGRAVRFKSHVKMPKDRQYVNIWRYWSTKEGVLCIDEKLYNEGLTTKAELDTFDSLLIQASIEENRE